MATIAKLDVILGMNSTAFDSSLAGVQARLNTFGQSAIRVGTMATMGLTLPLVGFAAIAIKAASDLEESMNKVNVVFGDSAAEIVAWSEGSAQSMGLSQRAALEYVGTLGNLMLASGLTQAETVELSTSLVQLAADLASFNNVPADQALIALRAALVGEYEPMRLFGVQLSEATVKAEAMALGLYNGEGAISSQARMMAVYSLIMQQTTSAQGDFIRTSDSLANAQRTARAEFEDAAATLGQQLLPMATQAVQALTQLIQSFNQLSPEAQKSAIAIGGFAAAIGPLLAITGLIASNLLVAGVAFTAFGAVMAGLYAPLNTFTGMLMATLSPLSLMIQAIRENAQAMMGFATDVSTVVSTVTAAFNLLVTNVGATLNTLVQTVKSQFLLAKLTAQTQVEEMKTSIITKITNLWSSVTSQMEAIKSTISTKLSEAKTAAVAAITSMTQSMGAQLAGFASTAAGLAYSIGAAIANGIKNGIAALASTAISAAQSLVDSVLGILSNIPGFSPIEHATAYYGAKAAQGFADGIASLEHRVANSSQNIVDAAMKPLNVQSSSEMGAAGGSNGAPVIIITPDPEKWVQYMRDAKAGGDFARNFGHELGLYAGQP